MPILHSALKKVLANQFIAHCDELQSTPSLVEQANAAIEEKNAKIKTPIQFENLKHTLQQGTVNNYDGFRLHVQKQVNLNTVVSHFYWLGSQAVGRQIYQYRLILPFDEKVVNVSTDADFNIDGEIKAPITKSISAKTNFSINDENSDLSISVDVSDESSASQLSWSSSNSYGLSYMQAITPYLTLGGSGEYNANKGTVTRSFGAIFEKDENMIAAQWDNAFKVLYLRRVNPNRVNLFTELTVDENASQMALAAEYILKQSKLHMSVDSNLTWKTLVESTLVPGITLQFCADLAHLKDQYRFGFGITMG